MDYRCITAEECKNLNIDKTSEPPFIPFQGICQEGCPKDFQMKYTVDGNKMSASCKPCIGKECWHACEAPIIDSIASLQTLKGCQVVRNSLEIQIKARSEGNTNIMNELQNSLSDIIEIEGYLKVSRSTPISSLNFLKSLKLIRGTHLDKNEYSVVIWDNPNIQHLFNENQKVEVENGKLFFHFNPKLCFYKIETLAANQYVIENYETAKLSNGDKTTCNITRLAVEVTAVFSQGATFKLTPLELDDERSILSNVVFYKETLEQNVDLWEGRDACGNDEWNSEDINVFAENETVSFSLNKLKPFTQYAYYVKVYVLASERSAQSDIQYLTTLPGIPEQPQKVRVKSKNDAEIVIK